MSIDVGMDIAKPQPMYDVENRGMPRMKNVVNGENTSPRQICVLLAEDDDEMRDFLTGALLRDGFGVKEIPDEEAFHRFLASISNTTDEQTDPGIDVIVSDIRMPGKTTLDVLTSLKQVVGQVPVVLITAFDDRETVNEAMRLGATRVFDKPFDIHEFKSYLYSVVT